MEDAGLLQEGDDPNSEQYAKYTNRLNDLINFWQTQGLKLWRQVDQSVALTAGKASYTFKPGGDISITRPLRALQGYYLDTSDVRRPLVVLSRDEHTRLSQTTQLGEINSYFVDKQVDQLVVDFWLTPDTTAATGTVHLILQQQIENFTGLTDALTFPIEWIMALRWGLADDISTGQPQAIMDRCTAKATVYRTALEDWDVEDASTRFTPDVRGMSSQGGFR
jgi:hypothetical protein